MMSSPERSLSIRGAALLSLAFATACTSSSSPAPPTAQPATTQPPAPTEAPRPVGTATSAADILAAMQAQLQFEASHRPAGGPTVEAVMQALQMGGVACLPGQQSLAALTEAAYCWQSRTADEVLAFSICEYPNDAAIQHSQAVSLSKFAAMGERTFVVQGHAMMTIKAHKPGADKRIAEIKKVLAAMR